MYDNNYKYQKKKINKNDLLSSSLMQTTVLLSSFISGPLWTESGRLIPTSKHSSYSTYSSCMTCTLKQRLLSGPCTLGMASMEKLDGLKSSRGVAAINDNIIIVNSIGTKYCT